MGTTDEWLQALEAVENADPEIAQAYADFGAVAMGGSAIARKYKELILVAAHASVTLMHPQALHHHISNALHQGATIPEILEALELVSVIGMHTCATGMPILLEELEAAGLKPTPPSDGHSAKVKEDFVSRRGWWNESLESIVLLRPDLLEAYIAFSTVPWARGALPPKIKEFIYIAIDSQTTHLYESGLRAHIRNALKLGATAAEIAEVFSVVSGLGYHAMVIGVKELQKFSPESH